MRTAAAILAAGASRRLGQPKQLVQFQGSPLIRHIATIALSTQGHATAVVLGAEAARVEAALAGVACERLNNPQWQEGMAASIRVAARWAQDRGHDALLLLTCDQLRLTAAHIDQLWDTWRARPHAPVASAYAATIGIPAVFPRADYPALLQLRGDRGAASLLRARDVSQVPWPAGSDDLDTPRDLAQLDDPP